jgi:hypothetical protein
VRSMSCAKRSARASCRRRLSGASLVYRFAPSGGPFGCGKNVADGVRRGYDGDAQIPVLCFQLLDLTGAISSYSSVVLRRVSKSPQDRELRTPAGVDQLIHGASSTDHPSGHVIFPSVCSETISAGLAGPRTQSQAISGVTFFSANARRWKLQAGHPALPS